MLKSYSTLAIVLRAALWSALGGAIVAGSLISYFLNSSHPDEIPWFVIGGTALSVVSVIFAAVAIMQRSFVKRLQQINIAVSGFNADPSESNVAALDRTGFEAATTMARKQRELQGQVNAGVRTADRLRRRTRQLAIARKRLKNIAQDLERLKESYRDLYQNAPVMYFSLDIHGNLATLNDTLLQTLGFNREDLIRKPYTLLLPPKAAEEWKRTGAAISASHFHDVTKAGELETQWLKKDGTLIDVWIRSVPILDAEGNFVRTRSAALDVTEKNRLANELRSRGDELERANNELRSTNRELEEFTSVVSHDLKEPLRTIQAFSSFLAEDYAGQLGPDAFQCINHLVQASIRLGSLIDDLLNLSGAGKVLRAPQIFNLIETVATVRRDLVDLMQRKDAELIVEGSLPDVIGDRPRIIQLLTNLVSNGLKYNKSAQPKVIIGEASEKQMLPPPHSNGRKPNTGIEREQVVLYVRDNGIGIPSRFHESIFGIFRRLHQADEYEGTGAGLAICKKIVEAHAGRIWVESEPDKGATFFFSLPRPRTLPVEALPPRETPVRKSDSKNSAAAKTDAPRRRVAESSSKNGSRAQILLVEDMPDIALITKKLAERAGQSIEWYSSAEDALEYLQTHEPDLMLLDIHLPGMSGLEFCQMLRSVPKFQRMAIALFTQGQEHQDLAWARQQGANYILTKDLLARPDVWIGKIQEILRTVPSAAEVRAR